MARFCKKAPWLHGCHGIAGKTGTRIHQWFSTSTSPMEKWFLYKAITVLNIKSWLAFVKKRHGCMAAMVSLARPVSVSTSKLLRVPAWYRSVFRIKRLPSLTWNQLVKKPHRVRVRRREKMRLFFTATCAWGKIPLRLPVWNFEPMAQNYARSRLQAFCRKNRRFFR